MRILALSFVAVVISSSSACAADWGYDDDYGSRSAKPERSQPEELKAQPLSLDEAQPGKKNAKLQVPNSKPQASNSKLQLPNSKNPPAKNRSANPGIVGHMRPQSKAVTTKNAGEITQSTIANWLSLLGLVAPIPDNGQLLEGPDYSNQLTDNQKQRFTTALQSMLVSDRQGEFTSIDRYWSSLVERMMDADQRGNYRLLFRALLSLRAEAPDVSDAEESIILEALGPKRLAEPGPPPLTEDAIHAYTDMACFLYDYSHPGRTVDADDNRELYGLKVRDMFKNAPTDKDREAMNNFPLSWAKFRILYQDADDEKRKLMAEKIASPEGLKGMNMQNSMLESVLSAPTWKRFVLNQKTSGSQSGSGAAGPRASYDKKKAVQ